MPRFNSNRWWIFILTIAALQLGSLAFSARTSADPTRESSWSPDEGILGGGAPVPNGAGDPDQPTPTSLKYYQRQSVGGGRVTLSSRPAGDRQIEGNVWMWRLSVMKRVLRAYWVRY